MKFPYLILIFVLCFVRVNAQPCPISCNGDFDFQNITTGVTLTTAIQCWSTTASNGIMEVWANGFNGVPSYNGSQFVELNATMAATMFQTVTVSAGIPLSVSFAHRGRAGIDSVEVSVGPVGGPYTSLGTFGDGTTVWGTYTLSHTATTNGLYEIRFTPVYWSGGNVAIGNFLDGIVVNTPVILTITATSQTICSGGTTTLTATGALSYTWIPIAVGPTLVVSPSVTTTYYLYGHSNACTNNDSITVVVSPSAPMAISGPTSICIGNSATLTASGSTTYTWNTSSNSSSIVVAPSSTTVYSVSGGVGNCSGSGIFTVSVINYPVVSVSNVSICPGQVATLTASGATTYTWNSPFGTGAAYTDNPLTTKHYTVIGSISGCTAIATASVILKPVPVPVISSNSPLCAGGNLSLNGGGGFSYFWSGPFSFTSSIQNPFINPVAVNNAGVYTLVVTSANNCTVSASTTVVVNPAPTLVAIAGTVCIGQTLNLNVSSSAGTTYTWTGPMGFNSTLQNVSFPLATVQHSGIYTVAATGANSCKSAATVEASVLPPPNPHISLSTQTICAQAFNGSPSSLTANFTGATSYSLNVPNYINNSNPLGPTSVLSMTTPYQPVGAVTATLYGFNGACNVSVTTHFTVIPNPSVIMSNPLPICVGQTSTYTASGAVTYTWSATFPGSISSVNNNVIVVSPSVTSAFSVVGTQAGCNSATQTNTLIVSPLPDFVIEPNPAVVCLGSPLILSTKGTGDTFIWAPSNALNSTSGSTVIITPTTLQNHNYTVVASINNCTNSAMVTVSVAPLPVPVITSGPQTQCVNNTVTLRGSGGVDYSWHGPAGYIGNAQNVTFTINSMAFAGLYTLTVTDQNKCQAKTTQLLTLHDLPHGYFAENQLKGCSPYCANLSFKMDATSAPANSMNWQINTSSFSGDNFKYCFKEAGEHQIKGTLIDTNTCVNVFTVAVNVYPKPVADFIFSPDVLVENRDEVSFINTSRGEQIKTWDWYFTNNKGYHTQDEHTSYLFVDGGNYPVALVATNFWLCSDTVVKSISIETDFTIYIPNIFTPNEDTRNEIFLPIIRGATFYQLQVFDRWGESIFETADFATGWDGTFKGQPCKSDSYIWKIGLTVQGIRKQFSGHVTLNR